MPKTIHRFAVWPLRPGVVCFSGGVTVISEGESAGARRSEIPAFLQTKPPLTNTRSGSLSPAARRALGGLLPLFDDVEVRDLLVQVNGGEGRLWVDRGGTLGEVAGWRATPASVHRLATELIAAGGRHLDELHPCADVQLGDGIRVHAVLPPVAVAGAAVSIRLPRLRVPEFSELVAAGLCSTTTAVRLQREISERRNLLITGGTGSGKTTVLAALIDLADTHERIVTIEDVAELRLKHAHAVALESRQANIEGAGEITVDRLLREALRMRPDRIVLGECRGAEIATLLAALNTGHDGGAGTLHASRLADVPARLEALGALAGLDHWALGRQAVSALHTVAHLVRGPEGHKIAALGKLVLSPQGTLAIEELTL